MKKTAFLLVILMVSACTEDHRDPRALTDKRFAAAQTKCNYEMRKAEGTMNFGGFKGYQYLEKLYANCMAVEGYQVTPK